MRRIVASLVGASAFAIFGIQAIVAGRWQAAPCDPAIVCSPSLEQDAIFYGGVVVLMVALGLFMYALLRALTMIVTAVRRVGRVPAEPLARRPHFIHRLSRPGPRV